MKIIGMRQPAAASWLCSCNPSMRGIRTSTIRHAVSCSWPEPRKSLSRFKRCRSKTKRFDQSCCCPANGLIVVNTEMRFPAPVNCLLNPCRAERMVWSNSSSLKGFPRNATAPACIARRRDSLSSYAVMKMIGMRQPAAASWLWSCSPFMPGICTSTMRHEVSCSWPELKKESQQIQTLPLESQTTR